MTIQERLLQQAIAETLPQISRGPGRRKPERSEMFDSKDSRTYIDGCDYPESSDYAIVAAEIARAFGKGGRLSSRIVEVCPGPGNLLGELLKVGANKVIGIDGDPVMIKHASNKFTEEITKGQMLFIQAMAQKLPLLDNSVDGIVNFNSFHQFSSEERILEALREMARVLVPGGWGLVRDFKRGASQEAINERLKHTKPEIAPLLLDSLQASFTSTEFINLLRQIPDIEFSVTDAQNPWRLSEEVCGLIRNDPVEHWRDFGISQDVKFIKL